MENVPYYSDEADDKEASLFDPLEKDDDQDDEVTEASKKKKKKAQSYLKDIFSKFFIVDKKLSDETEKPPFGEAIITPFISYEEITELPKPVYVEAIGDSVNAPAEIPNQIKENIGTSNEYSTELIDQRNEHYNQSDYYIQTKSDREPLNTMVFENKVYEPQKHEHPAVKHKNFDAEKIGPAMVRQIEKKKIKGLEAEVAKVRKKIKQVEKAKNQEKRKEPVFIGQERLLDKQKNVYQDSHRPENTKKHSDIEKDRIKYSQQIEYPKEIYNNRLADIRKKIEAQYLSIEDKTLNEQYKNSPKHELQKKPEAHIGNEKYIEKQFTHPVQAKHQNSSSAVSQAMLQYEKSKNKILAIKKISSPTVLQSNIPQNYKQAVLFGVSYGVVLTVVFLLLIAMRLI